jgi:hypothetical protein
MTLNESQDLNVTDLTEILQQLTLIRAEQRVLKEEVTDLTAQVRAHQQRLPQSSVTSNTAATEVNRRVRDTTPRTLRRKDLKVGDQVTIINPKGNQLPTGTVVGFTPTGFVRVQTVDQNVIRRFPFNLQK